MTATTSRLSETAPQYPPSPPHRHPDNYRQPRPSPHRHRQPRQQHRRAAGTNSARPAASPNTSTDGLHSHEGRERQRRIRNAMHRRERTQAHRNRVRSRNPRRQQNQAGTRPAQQVHPAAPRKADEPDRDLTIVHADLAELEKEIITLAWISLGIWVAAALTIFILSSSLNQDTHHDHRPLSRTARSLTWACT